MATTTPKVLIPSKIMESAQTTQYTAVGVKTYIDKFTMTNTSGANATFNVCLVTSAGAPAASNTIVINKTLVPNESYLGSELVGQVLEPGDYISTSGTASALTMRACGREISQ